MPELPRSEAGTPGGGTAAPVPLAWSAWTGLAALALYLALAPRVSGEGDSPEFTLVLAVAGVPHPSGYPLYTLVGHTWVVLLHALGMGWERAANGWSAVGAGMAVGLAHALAARLIPGEALPAPRGRALAALLPVGVFALHPAWLAQATLAEVYGWHVAIVSAMALAALAVVRRASSPDSGGGSGEVLLGLAVGAGLAHHLTSVFFAVPLAGAATSALWRAGRLRPATVAGFALAAALPLAAHAFTAYRALHPARFQWPLLEPGALGLLAHARGQVFTVFLGHFDPDPEQRLVLVRAVLPLLVPALVALAAACIRLRDASGRRILIALLAAAAIQVGFVLVYGVPDCVPYFLPALLATLPAVAIVAASAARRAGPALATSALAVTLLVTAIPGIRSVLVRNRRLEGLEAALHERWRAIPFDRGIVLWQGDGYTRLLAWQILRGERPGLFVENPAMLTWPGPRRAFERRFGVDPLDGLELHDDSDLAAIAPNLWRLLHQPVVDFARWRP